MTTRRLNRLIHTTTAADHSQHRFVHEILCGEKTESRVNIGRHLVACRGEVRILSVLAASKASKIQRERVVPGGTQHGSECVVNLPIRVALVEQENSRSDLSGRVHCCL